MIVCYAVKASCKAGLASQTGASREVARLGRPDIGVSPRWLMARYQRPPAPPPPLDPPPKLPPEELLPPLLLDPPLELELESLLLNTANAMRPSDFL